MDNKRKIGEEELKRALLMMKYDSRKTLTENVEELNEQSTDYGTIYSSVAAGIGAGALIGNIPGAVIGGVAGLIYGLQSQTGSFEAIAKVLESCKTGVGAQVMSDDAIRNSASSMYRAIEGIGTDEEGIRSAIDNLRTFPDFCKMAELYEKNYGESLGAAWDDDINDPADWTNYVHIPLQNLIERTKVLDETKLSAETTSSGATAGEGEVQTLPVLGNYKICTGTYTQGCYSEKIKQIQTCLGLVSDGKYGPKTQAALEGVGFGGGFKDSDIETICNASTMPEPDLDLPTPDEDIDSLN